MNRKQSPRGIILLVVLSSLTFFSVLIAAYLVFSNQSRESSFAISVRNVHQPDVNGIIDEALMKLIRGTSNSDDPFFGEDLLSDFYGRRDARELTMAQAGVALGTSGFARFDVTDTLSATVDDLLSGRVVTFRSGASSSGGTAHPLVHRSFRVLRSVYDTGTTQHRIILDVGDDVDPTEVPAGTKIWVNGVPRNAAGVGYQASTKKIDLNATPQTSLGGLTLPIALQPNHLKQEISKLPGSDTQSDFDEGYDAADFNNWFLAHNSTIWNDANNDGVRDASEVTTHVIPSFHRPSVINYILNDSAALSSPNDLAISIARGTFRPVPIHANHAGGTAINEQFTGGNSNFALRVPLDLSSQARLDQFAKSLISPVSGWDVDNDSDGFPESVWVNIGLPLITSPDGKLLQPLVAPLIEDLSARLNVNAHGNSQVATYTTAGLLNSSGAAWAGTNAATPRNVFRGLGYGPAEIGLPSAVAASLVSGRLGTDALPGYADGDGLDVLRSAWRPSTHTYNGAYGYSLDPFGRGGVAIGRSGYLVAANSGTTISATQNENLNDPYESDPSGRLAGDSMLTHDELEAVLRSNDFDIDLLPTRLRSIVASVANADRIFTTVSKSDETPPPVNFATAAASAFETLRSSFFPTMTDAQLKELIAPEIRLGRKLDVNRRFGNGVDDDGDTLIDEPGEVPATGVASTTNRIDDDFDGTVDESGELGEPAFAVSTTSTSTIPSNFTGQEAFYNRDSLTAVNGKELFARYLYVLMMALSRDYTFPVAGTSTDPADYHARRLAQWAVNVVDYRDPDSIMTRFVYDKNPFDGWDVPATATNENTVWGVEAPELLLTETLAFHDVAVQDTSTGGDKGPDPTDDPNTDQFGLPTGSLFVELYCPGSDVTDSSVRSYPQELYNNQYLELGQVSGSSPVWRIAISEPHYFKDIAVEGTTPLTNIDASASAWDKRPSLRRRNAALGEAYSYSQEENELGITASANQLKFERYVLFTDSEYTLAGMTSGNTFYLGTADANNAAAQLARGQYACLLPRTATTFGYESDKTTPSKQAIAYNATNGVTHFSAGASSAPLFAISSQFSVPKAFVATTTAGIPLNVSAPLTGYDTTANPLPADIPYDVANVAIPTVTTGADKEPFIGTVPEHCSVFLQRLADPTRAWNPVTNPYRVVDYMPVDLNVFSGQERPSVLARTDPADAATEIYEPKYRRRSRQKNGAVFDASGNLLLGQDVLYSYISEFANTGDDQFDNYDTDIDTSADFFSFAATDGHFFSSLGFLNTTQTPVNPFFDNGFTDPFRTDFGLANHDRNLPRTGFAIHPWLNRPFTSHHELVLVPACSQGRLFEEMSIVATGDPSIYPVDPVDLAQFSGAFRHLLNFFHSDRDPAEAANFVQLFDFVQTTPPYRGETEYLAPSRVAGTDLEPLLSPPFNVVSERSRIGTLNLNTIADFEVWKGLMQGHLNTNEFTSPSGAGTSTQLIFDNLLASRKGYGVGTGGPVTGTAPYNYDTAKLDSTLPTQFAGVFRGSSHAPLFPDLRDATASDDAKRRPVNGTLLRGEGDLKTSDPDRGGTATLSPLFVRKSTDPPLVASGAQMDRQRNAFMRYQTLMRMPNLVADNSQVFLIRLTLGFFEVDASNTNNLGREYGESTGKARRYQAMFIVDRSIPVGFVPGQDLNARDTVVFERYFQ
ncbi:hypothetical protein [Aporhodopirellula aestuarii]|uniref:Uncharacterized protein n=1 Tax=Aporhodopirellula aestuarii TaxID=2950107 RepID=A0ABT0U4D2_9BACT|nr:hypothetical protein [Aporhodopirellula aestuarii]MCM2371757.1 hypothetical protein [Aporhodopirellula aestuarii]